MAEASEKSLPRPRTLPAAPQRIVEAGAPIEGAWSGAVADASFSHLTREWSRGFLHKRLVEKRWAALFLATDEAMLSFAIVDTGYLSTGILCVFDRGSRRTLIDSHPVLPPLLATLTDEANDGMRATLAGPRITARFERSGGRIVATARWQNAAVDLSLDARAAPPPLSVVSRLGAGRFNYTQKLAGIPAEGEISVANVRYRVRGEPAGLDFTHGYLPRDTAWRWAFCSARQGGRLVAFNFSDGFMRSGGGENVVWLDGAPCSVGRVHFDFEPSAPLAPWRIESEDGTLAVTFQPEGYRAQNIDLKLVASRYVQPFGVFSGHVTTSAGERVEVDSLPGVTEDHSARW
ncbi:MAG TPA: DUF2804 domain-containing protein [Myxococcales bacterium]|nr:DUF2804 domain-containing protein [Myxococcales bacterium]